MRRLREEAFAACDIQLKLGENWRAMMKEAEEAKRASQKEQSADAPKQKLFETPEPSHKRNTPRSGEFQTPKQDEGHTSEEIPVRGRTRVREPRESRKTAGDHERVASEDELYTKTYHTLEGTVKTEPITLLPLPQYSQFLSWKMATEDLIAGSSPSPDEAFEWVLKVADTKLTEQERKEGNLPAALNSSVPFLSLIHI